MWYLFISFSLSAVTPLLVLFLATSSGSLRAYLQHFFMFFLIFIHFVCIGISFFSFNTLITFYLFFLLVELVIIA